MDLLNLPDYIDHTLLKPETSEENIVKLCREAKENKFKAVCVLPTHVNLASKLLVGTDVKVATVIGFPLGANLSVVKALEATEAINSGATELDMVINIGAIKDKNYELVKRDIVAVVDVAHATCPKALVKVIIETSLLTDEEKQIACQLSLEAGAEYVKTSTGFSGGGATVEDVRLMKSVVGEQAKVKASGGVRSYEDAVKMIEAGSSRIGTSSGVKIINGATVSGQEY